MALARRDVRFKLDEEMHRALKIFAKHDGLLDGEFVEKIILRELARRIHDATLTAAQLQVAGITGKGGESASSRRNTSNSSID